MRVLIAILGIIGIGYLGICAWLYFRQSSLVFFPYKTLEATPANYGMTFEEIQIESSDSSMTHPTVHPMIHGWFISADTTAKSKVGTILFCHGNGGNLSHRLDLMLLWSKLGFDVLGFDYQGYGQSEGVVSEAATYADVRACWDYLVKDREIAADRILVLGRSLGAAVATDLVAKLSESGESNAAGVVLEAPFTSITDMGARLYPLLPVRLLTRFEYDNQANLSKINVPVMIMHGVDDPITPFSMGEEVFRSANESKRFVKLAGGHEDTYLIDERLYSSSLTEFASDCLSKR